MLNRIALKKLLAISFATLVAAILVLLVLTNSLLNGIHADALQGQSLEKSMLLAKEARFQTIQIQQFLTDAGATAEEASFVEATKARDATRSGLEALGKRQPELAADIARLEADIARLHDIGVSMARAYIGEGREAGNRIMNAPATASTRLPRRSPNASTRSSKRSPARQQTPSHKPAPRSA